MLKRLVMCLLILVLLIPVLPTAAQGDPVPQVVEIEAADGVLLIGDYYAPPEGDPAPAMLLMHMLGSKRQAWYPLVPTLVEAGYAVLAFDFRGHGDTGGDQDWVQSEADVQLLIDWLRAQPGIDPEQINLAGGSIGANLSLVGMANDDGIATIVALSPGLGYLGVATDAAAAAIDERPVFIVVSQQDFPSIDDVQTLLPLFSGDVQLAIYDHGAHGTGMFLLERDLDDLIVMWLDRYN
ncbi:MAG: alpha/beta fold hydrolase [Anaerolineae bacterium]|nr:alpha/beta fold hydrolase [Anaerolineae bacterium]